MRSAGFHEVEHTADWALHVWGPDIPALLQAAAQGMYALMHVEIANAPRVTRTIRLPPSDPEDILVDFLSELLFLYEAEGLAFDRFEFQPQRDGWQVVLEGAPLQSLGKEIKAVTYHDLHVRRTPNGLETTVVFDV